MPRSNPHRTRRLRPRSGERGALLEREAELSRLELALEQAVAESGRLVVVEGPAGIGKTVLLEAAGDRAQEMGIQVHAARGSEIEAEFPYGIVLQLLERAVSADEPERLFAGAARLARAMFDPAASGWEERSGYSLIHGLYWILCNLAYSAGGELERPQVLLVDDAHWADQSSLRFLLYLAHRLRELPITLVIALRHGEPSLAEDLVGKLREHPRTWVITPAPLSLAGASAFLEGGSSPGKQFCEACWDASGGNPFLLRELIVELEEAGVAPVDQNVTRVRQLVPDTVLRNLLGRLARIAPSASAVARAVAVLEDEAYLRSVAELAEIPGEEAVAVVDALSSAGLLAAEQIIAFMHPLIRTAVLHDCSGHLRRLLHGRASALLNRHGAPVERVAAHLLLAEVSADGWALGALREAARRALVRGAPGAAADFLSRAAEFPSSPEIHAEVLKELAEAQARTGLPAATETLAEAIDVLAEPVGRAEALLALGRMLFSRARFAEAAGAFARGRSELNGSEDLLGRELEVGHLAAAAMDPGLRADAIAQLERHLRDGPIGDAEPALLAQLALRGAVAGDQAAQVRRLAEAALSDDSLIQQAVVQGLGFGLAVSALVFVDAFDSAERAADRLIHLSRDAGSVVGVAAGSTWRSWVRYLRGDILDAMADAEQALEARRDGWELYLGVSASALVHGHLERDDLPAARDVLGSLAPRPAEEPLMQVARARLCLMQGEAQKAFQLACDAGHTYSQVYGIVNPAILPWRSWAALAAHRSGEPAEARRLAQEELVLAERVEAPRSIGIALRAAALLERGGRRVEGLRQAVATLDASPARLEHARATIDLGAALRRTGERKEARQILAQGREAAHRMGASSLATWAEQELRAAGARPRRVALSGPASLTPSERRVAELAAGGLTNREIAQALFVTIKAVEQHLRNAYRKLDVPSRAGLRDALLV